MISRGLRPLNPRLGVIVNPSSAGGRSLAIWQNLGLNAPYHISKDEIDFRKTTRQFAKKFRRIAVCGGDSSLTIAAEELAAVKYRGALEFIPAGSVNDIVLDIRDNTASAKKPVYLGSLSAGNSAKTFIGQANWGLGVVVNRWVGAILHALPFLRPLQNFIGTACIVVAHLLRREIVQLTITADGQNFDGCYSVVLVSQIRHWASGLEFCPQASYYAPEFQLVAIRRCGLLQLLRIVLAAKHGAHLRFPEVLHRTVKNIAIGSPGPVQAQVDGDLVTPAADFRLSKRKCAFSLSCRLP